MSDCALFIYFSDNKLNNLDLLLAMLLIFMGSFVQCSIGFGLAIVTAPLLFLLSPNYVPAPIVLVALFLSLFNTYRYRQSISLRGLGAAIAGRVPGSLLGGLILYIAHPDHLGVWIGIIVMLGVLTSLLPVRIQPTGPRLLVAGFLSGVFGTTTAIGGPPMALLLQHQESNHIRANLSAFFLFSSLLSLLIQIPAGYMSVHHLKLTLPLLPAAFFGYWLAGRFVTRIPKHYLRAISLWVCAISAMTAILTSLF